MPGIFHRPISRQQFLKTSVGVAASWHIPTFRWGSPSDEEVHWALLSDTHVASDREDTYRGFKPYENLKALVPQVQKINPQGVIINGDVARLAGEPADYQLVKALLNPLTQDMPVHMTLGNHDDRDHFARAFPTTRTLVEEKYVHVIETSPVRMILLDSLLYVNKVVGLLGKKQRRWLELFLDSAEQKPTLIFVHHTLGDEDSDLQDVERMFAIIRPHPSVKAVLYGHSHQYKYQQRDGIHLINLPAVGYNFTDDEPVGWVEARLSSRGGDFTLHARGGNQSSDGKTTHLDWRP